MQLVPRDPVFFFSSTQLSISVYIKILLDLFCQASLKKVKYQCTYIMYVLVHLQPSKNPQKKTHFLCAQFPVGTAVTMCELNLFC